MSLTLIRAADIAPASVAWAWRDRIPFGMLSLLVGHPGLGKSTFLCELLARLSRGELPGDAYGTPLTCLLVSAEDSAAYVLAPRLAAAGADLARIQLVTEEHWLALPDDCEHLAKSVAEVGARIIVVDPLSAYFAEGIDAHKDADIRRALGPLSKLAETTMAAVLGVLHLGKGQHSHALHKVLGSVALTAAPRSVLVLGADPDDEDGPSRLLGHLKCNVAPLAPTLRVQIESRGTESADGSTIATSGITWDGEAPGVRAVDLVSPPSEERRTAVDDARAVLRRILAFGQMPAEDAEKELKQVGIKDWAWKLAKKQLKVRTTKTGFHGRWTWSLPEGDDDHLRHPRSPSSSPSSPSEPISGRANPQGDEEDEGDDPDGGGTGHPPPAVNGGREPGEDDGDPWPTDDDHSGGGSA